MAHVQTHRQGPLVVEGTRRSVVARPAGRRVPGEARVTLPTWPWRDSPQAPGLRDARVTARSAPNGRVTLVRVDPPGEARCDWLGRAATRAAPRLIRAWSRRRWREHPFRPRKPVWATAAGHVPTADASDGPLGWRVWAGLVRLSTARVRLQGRVTRDAIVFRLTHDGRFLHSDLRACQALSWDLRLEAA